MRKTLVALLAVSLLATVPSRASGEGFANARRAIDRVVERGREAASLAARGSAAAALDAALALGGRRLVPRRAPFQVGALAHVAEPLARDLVADGERAAAAVHAPRADLRAAQRDLGAIMGEHPHAEASFAAYRRRYAGLAAAIDRDAIAQAGLDAAAEIDSVLPDVALAASPATGVSVVGCDVMDEPPLLCIGGTNDNTYRGEYALTIDLGGDDLYANSGGGSDALNGRPASVVIDVAGDDRYVAPPDSVGYAQGSSNYGLGMLIDLSGNDTYEATNGQGLGYAGVGLLEDLAGNDVYSLRDDQPRTYGSSAIGEGFAVFGAIGALVDESGDDTYTVESHAPSVLVDGVVTAISNVEGFGLGAFAADGLWFDAHGRDTVTMRASTDTVPATESRPLNVNANVNGFGMGVGPFGGAGGYITGDGDGITTAEAEAAAPSVGFAFTDALGYGIGDGDGLALDLGGDDVYRTGAETHADRSLVVNDSCGCEMSSAPARVPAVQSMGYGSLAGVGVQRDLSGDDVYDSHATATSVLNVRDARTIGAQRARGSAQAGYAEVQSLGSSMEGTGSLQDLAGDDEYDSDSSSDAHSTVTSDHPDARPPEADAGAFAASFSEAFAALGYAELIDTGGTDRYGSRNVVSATADPPTQISRDAQAFVQGAVVDVLIGDPAPPDTTVPVASSVLVDADGGAPDSFSSLPESQACTGARGGAAWVDCRGPGIGSNT
jgi:hypothetical protein